MIKNLEQALTDKVNSAKIAVQEKLFKQFVSAIEQDKRDEIGAKMNVLDNVIFELIKEVRKSIT